MRKALQIFIIGFIGLYSIDTLISAFNYTYTYFFEDIKSLNKIHEVLAYTVIFLAFPLISFICVSKLPKKNILFYLPLSAIFIFCFGSFTQMFTAEAYDLEMIFFGKEYELHKIFNSHIKVFAITIIMSIVQSFFCLWAILFLKKEWQIFEKVTDQHTGLRVFNFFAVPSFLTVVTLLSMAIPLPTIFESASQHYISFAGGNIYTVEKVFAKDGKQVRLIPMVHIGKKEFYEEIHNDLNKDVMTLFLLEGIRDKDNLLSSFDNYKDMAKDANLDMQQEHFKPWEHVEIEDGKVISKVNTIYADIDASEMDKKTIEYLKIATESDISKKISHLGKTGFEHEIYYDLIERRNNSVMSLFKENQNDYDVFIIPWGALHLPDIEKKLVQLGYKDQGQYKKRLAINLLEIFDNPKIKDKLEDRVPANK